MPLIIGPTLPSPYDGDRNIWPTSYHSHALTLRVWWNLTGKLAAVIIRDFSAIFRSSGPAAPLAANAAVSEREDAFKIDWGCTDRLVTSATADLPTRKIAQAPPYSSQFLTTMGRAVASERFDIGVRLFAPSILHTVRACLRCSDMRGLRPLANRNPRSADLLPIVR